MAFIDADNITNLLQTFLDVQSRRAQIISSNIANADTPGYVAKELDFEDFLRDAASKVNLPQSTLADSGDSVAALRTVDQTPTKIGLDGNTVDAGREMAELAQTSINFNLGAKMLQSRLRLLRAAIHEGR
ncbi:MAG: flagellar basal body rod protein FlgB [Pyrinomonadaceae bacterium]|nr:flagellar basal body rod protein FlgB [Pyrinomonadaceae bacterium]